MRMFWIVIGVLAVIAAVVFWRSESSGSKRDAATINASRDGTAPPATPSIDANRPRDAQPSDAATASPDALADRAVAPAAPSLRNPANAATAAPGSPAPAPAKPTEQNLADELMASADQNQDENIDEVLGEDMPMAPGNHDEGDVGGAPGALSGPLVDGKYIVAGDGSAEAPFEITWDLLVLASQTYQPRQGRTELPPQVQAVNGKRIKLAGYFAVPIASTDPKEVLFMLNMWDGCCIGIPPSPYDAVEVRLKEPLGGGKQFVNYATLTGTLVVDPYVQNGWLLGMYVMSDGELEIGM